MESERVEEKSDVLLSGVDDVVEEVWQNQSFIPFRVSD